MNADTGVQSTEVDGFVRNLQRRLDSIRHLLEIVRLCQSMPEPERTRTRSPFLRFDRGYIYLMEKLRRVVKPSTITYKSFPNCPYKIGATKHPKRRSNALWKQKRLITREKYCTPVPFALEKALHSHFNQFRIRRVGERQRGVRKNERGELFRLPPEEAEAFKATAANIERWVLVAEEARLELEVMRMEAALRDPIAAAKGFELDAEGPP